MSCNCNHSYSAFISAGISAILVNMLLAPETEYHWEITDQHGNVYPIPFTTDADGRGSIAAAELPAGFLNPAMGKFIVRLKASADDCAYLPIPILSRYPALELGAINAGASKTTVGCPFTAPYSPSTDEDILILE